MIMVISHMINRWDIQKKLHPVVTFLFSNCFIFQVIIIEIYAKNSSNIFNFLQICQNMWIMC